MRYLPTVALALTALAATPAAAHLAPEEHGSFAAGFTHPVFGTDHVLAMVCVGLWATLLMGRAMWALPAAFVGAMAFGFILALAGVSLPFVEPAILASVIAFGVLVALATRLPLSGAMALVGVFGLFHGHAHGGEMGSATALAYLGGFAIATALLHGVGLVLGLGLVRLGPLLTRGAGGVVALAGAALVLGG